MAPSALSWAPGRLSVRDHGLGGGEALTVASAGRRVQSSEQCSEVCDPRPRGGYRGAEAGSEGLGRPGSRGLTGTAPFMALGCLCHSRGTFFLNLSPELPRLPPQ